MNWAIENFFPLITTKRRSIDPPWINKAVKKLIKGRKKVFLQKRVAGQLSGRRLKGKSFN